MPTLIYQFVCETFTGYIAHAHVTCLSSELRKWLTFCKDPTFKILISNMVFPSTSVVFVASLTAEHRVAFSTQGLVRIGGIGKGCQRRVRPSVRGGGGG